MKLKSDVELKRTKDTIIFNKGGKFVLQISIITFKELFDHDTESIRSL